MDLEHESQLIYKLIMFGEERYKVFSSNSGNGRCNIQYFTYNNKSSISKVLSERGNRLLFILQEYTCYQITRNKKFGENEWICPLDQRIEKYLLMSCCFVTLFPNNVMACLGH